MARLSIGDPMPAIPNLPGADWRSYSSQSFDDADLLVVAFFCNHCPYAHAVEERLKEFARDAHDRSVRLLVINPNDETEFPDESYEHMVLRAREHEYPFAYVRDADQETARSFGATHTPEFFVFDAGRRLRYHGAFDDAPDEGTPPRERYVERAVEALRAGEEIPRTETNPIGCTIKWCRESV